MKLNILKDMEIEVCVGFEDGDEDEPIFEDKTLKAGEVYDVDLLEKFDDRINIQFSNGDYCYGLRLGDHMEVIEDGTFTFFVEYAIEAESEQAARQEFQNHLDNGNLTLDDHNEWLVKQEGKLERNVRLLLDALDQAENDPEAAMDLAEQIVGLRENLRLLV